MAVDLGNGLSSLSCQNYMLERLPLWSQWCNALVGCDRRMSLASSALRFGGEVFSDNAFFFTVDFTLIG